MSYNEFPKVVSLMLRSVYVCILSPYMGHAVCMLSMLVSFFAVDPIDLLCQPELVMEPILIESPDEVLLKELCYLATGIQQLHVGPDGGNFTLGSGDASLEFPAGALKEETAVRFAIILHGPFVFPDGCKLGSVVVYINLDEATLLKPVHLNLSHWCSREEGGGNSLKSLRAPHVPGAGKKYLFEELEEGDFTTHTNVGTLTIPEPQCLYCVEMKDEEVARYNALKFQRYEKLGSPLYFRIQLTCDSKEWNKVCATVCEVGGLYIHMHMWSSHDLPCVYMCSVCIGR